MFLQLLYLDSMNQIEYCKSYLNILHKQIEDMNIYVK